VIFSHTLSRVNQVPVTAVKPSIVYDFFPTGLYSNAVDHKQPMLCESIRQFRRDLALVLLLHYRTNNEKIEDVLSVLLEKERYGFMSSSQTPKLPANIPRHGGGAQSASAMERNGVKKKGKEECGEEWLSKYKRCGIKINKIGSDCQRAFRF